MRYGIHDEVPGERGVGLGLERPQAGEERAAPSRARTGSRRRRRSPGSDPAPSAGRSSPAWRRRWRAPTARWRPAGCSSVESSCRAATGVAPYYPRPGLPSRSWSTSTASSRSSRQQLQPVLGGRRGEQPLLVERRQRRHRAGLVAGEDGVVARARSWLARWRRRPRRPAPGSGAAGDAPPPAPRRGRVRGRDRASRPPRRPGTGSSGSHRCHPDAAHAHGGQRPAPVGQLHGLDDPRHRADVACARRPRPPRARARSGRRRTRGHRPGSRAPAPGSAARTRAAAAPPTGPAPSRAGTSGRRHRQAARACGERA